MDNASVTPIRLVIRTSAPCIAHGNTSLIRSGSRSGSRRQAVVGSVDAPCRLDFGDGGAVEGSIVALEPGRRFAHRWASIDAEPRQETLVAWTLTPLDPEGTEIELVHGGWDEAGAGGAQRDDREACRFDFLDDLRDDLEEAPGS
ncbi:MAG: SRPBCC domain-containing protein [Chloroflexi bacterium]|nr:SRPBCC domain-containing protein [Chloroflexota bacterium]